MPFFFSVRIACVERVIVTFWPSTTKVFFCRFGLKTRLVRRKEKLTLWPNCLPFPVKSQRAAIGLLLPLTFYNNLLQYTRILTFRQEERGGIINRMDIAQIVIVLGIILVSMMLHEVMHGFVALKLGDDTARLLGRLSINPLKHVDPFLTIIMPLMIVVTNSLSGANLPIFGGAKPVPVNPANIRNEWGMALIAISGPLVNLVLAFISFGIAVSIDAGSASLAGNILSTSIAVNLGFFAFNILPIPPLDGSRVLYALAPEFVRRGMEAIERYGAVFILAVVLLFNDVLFVYMRALIGVIYAAFATIFGIS